MLFARNEGRTVARSGWALRGACAVGVAGLIAAASIVWRKEPEFPAHAQALLDPYCPDLYSLTVHTNAVAPGPAILPVKQIAWQAPTGVVVPMYFDVVYKRLSGNEREGVDSVHLLGLINADGQMVPLNQWPAPDASCSGCEGGPIFYGTNPIIARNQLAGQCQSGLEATGPCFADVDHLLLFCPRLAPVPAGNGLVSRKFSSVSYWFAGDGSPHGIDGSVDGYLRQTDLPCASSDDRYHLFQDPTMPMSVNVAAWGTAPGTLEVCANIMFQANE